MVLDGKIPSGPLEQKWQRHLRDSRLINPANRRRFKVIVVGSGLAEMIVDTFLSTPFSNEERHIRRISKIEEK